jgi:hypothetical protein
MFFAERFLARIIYNGFGFTSQIYNHQECYCLVKQQVKDIAGFFKNQKNSKIKRQAV